jgi:hypothetical protein
MSSLLHKMHGNKHIKTDHFSLLKIYFKNDCSYTAMSLANLHYVLIGEASGQIFSIHSPCNRPRMLTASAEVQPNQSQPRHIIGGWVCLEVDHDICVKISPPQDFKHQTVDTVASLYRLRCYDRLIYPQKYCIKDEVLEPTDEQNIYLHFCLIYILQVKFCFLIMPAFRNEGDSFEGAGCCDWASSDPE